VNKKQSEEKKEHRVFLFALWEHAKGLITSGVVAISAAVIHILLYQGGYITLGYWWSIITSIIAGLTWRAFSWSVYKEWSKHTDAQLEHLKIEFQQERETICSNLVTTLGPLASISEKLPTFAMLGHELERLIDKADKTILSEVLLDQVKLLGDNEHIITMETYLKLLAQFEAECSKVYCVNTTLPIFWFSPNPRDSEFVRKYAEQLGTKAHRVTVIDNYKSLCTQFEYGLDEISRRYETYVLAWFLILVQQLSSQDNIELFSRIFAGRITGEYEKNLKYTLLISDDPTTVAEGLLTDSAIADSVRKCMEEFREVNDNCKYINSMIRKCFVKKYSRNGSYYISRQKLKHAFWYAKDYEGEFGVYIDEKGKPTRAFGTKSEFGSLIRLRGFQPQSLHKELLRLFEDLMKQSTSALHYAGNMEDMGD
jgi:hypothetical protein